MAVAREPSPPIAMPHSIQSYQGSSADGGDTESVMSDLSWDGTPDENILSGSSRAATSLAIHEEDEGEPLRFLDDTDGDHTLIMDDDVYHQLAEMEEKLKMAGEFGNALLEENQELRILNQQIKQETSAKIEALEQERHELRMKLETAHTEKENMSYDLRMEVESLRKELANKGGALKVANSNKQGIIGELMDQKDQNQKLTSQLNEMRRERDSIHDRLKVVEEQNESMTLFHHESSLGKSEQLRVEVGALKDENSMLGERLVNVSSEHMTMMSNVQEAKERNMMLEKQVLELEQRLHFREAELRDLSRLHEETMQELGAARSRANTHCSSSLYDELETAELTGYESSDEDLEVDDKADAMISKALGSRGINRQMSLAEELAQSLGAIESSGMGHPPQEMSLAEEMNAIDVDQTPRYDKTLEDFVRGCDDRYGTSEGEFKQSERCHDNGSQHQGTSLADELAEAVHNGRYLQGEFNRVPQQEEMNTIDNEAQSRNALSLADELSQASPSMPNMKLESSSTLVGDLGRNIERENGSGNTMQSDFILGGDDDDDEDERMMLGVPMATQCLNQGLSLADELADMGYQQSYQDDGPEGDEEEGVPGGDQGFDEIRRSNLGAEMVASRVREGGGQGFVITEEGAAVEDDDGEVTSLETPKASPSRSPRPGDLQIRYRQIEDVLHWVHVTLTHIILELHSLVRLPLTDLGIMHASSVLHSVHPSSSSHHTPATASRPWSTDSPRLDLDDDDDDDGGMDEGQRSELIGDKVKSQLSVLRSMLSIVVNGSPKMMEDCVIQIEEEERARRIGGSRDGASRVQTHMEQDVHHYRVDLRDGTGWQTEPEVAMDERSRQGMDIPSPTDTLASSFSARSQSAPEFGRKTTFPFWS